MGDGMRGLELVQVEFLLAVIWRVIEIGMEAN